MRKKIINAFKKEILSFGEDNNNDYPLDVSTEVDDVKRLK